MKTRQKIANKLWGYVVFAHFVSFFDNYIVISTPISFEKNFGIDTPCASNGSGKELNQTQYTHFIIEGRPIRLVVRRLTQGFADYYIQKVLNMESLILAQD